MMIKLYIRISILLLVLNQLRGCEGLRGFGGRGYSGGNYGNKGYKEQQSIAKNYPSSGISNQNIARRGLGISAWGIVTVVCSFILAIVGLYYFSICYPVICQKNRKYDMMGLTSVV